jgi:hypothetical protein
MRLLPVVFLGRHRLRRRGWTHRNAQDSVALDVVLRSGVDEPVTFNPPVMLWLPLKIFDFSVAAVPAILAGLKAPSPILALLMPLGHGDGGAAGSRPPRLNYRPRPH